MAEILGLGVTHSPLLLGSDARMAGIAERVPAGRDASGMGGTPGRRRYPPTASAPTANWNTSTPPISRRTA